jgi:dTDP-4-amino-4,6-dideoxygalactose transaminase
MRRFDEPIYVTRPDLPSLDDYREGLEAIWARGWLTNHGPVVRRFEAKLAAVLQTENLSLFNSGASALEIGLQGLGLEGEVITTPFTFAATINAMARLSLRPVFVDVEPERLTLDPERVEAAITPQTTAILAVHMFGAPCQVDRLAEIAQRRGLTLIYDAALAFGVSVGGRPISMFGDLTMFSFHATKPFHTVEGGAATFAKPELKAVLDALCNHGLEPDGDVRMAGANAKMSELHALMGELMLDRFADGVTGRQAIEVIYRDRLGDTPGIRMPPPVEPGGTSNHGFMPVLVEAEAFGMNRDQLFEALQGYNVFTRRYFDPLVSEMSAYRAFRKADPLAVAHRVAAQVLSLPIYVGLALEDVHRICDLVVGLPRQ